MVMFQSISVVALDMIIINLKLIMLISAVMVITKFFKSTASMRHAVWFVLFMTILLLPIISTLTPMWHLPILKRSALSTEYKSITESPELAETVATAAISQGEADVTIVPTLSSRSAAIDWRSLFTLLYFWMALWMVGFISCNLRYGIGQFRLYKLIKEAQSATDGLTSSYRREIKKQYNLSSNIRILKSKNVITPLTTGFIHPVIILPDEYLKWSHERLRFVLLHEIAHIKRRDVITQFCVHLITTMYWFNPLIWLAQKQFIIERELACDDMVILHSTNPSSYADVLLDIAKSSLLIPQTVYDGLSMARPTQIEGRLLAILNKNLRRTRTDRFISMKTGLLLVLIIVPIVSFSPFAIGNDGQAVDTTHTALVIESLHNALYDDDGDVRERAIKTLGKINTRTANDLLFTSLQESNDWEIQFNAARILLQRGETRALQKFVDGLLHDQVDTRIRSAKILKELKHPEALGALVNAMADSNVEVRRQSLTAICEIRSTKCINSLAQQMANDKQEFRALAAWGLGEIKDAAALPYLYPALKDGDAKVRCNAVESIGDIKLAESAPYIQPLLKDQEWWVRREAVKVLAEIHSIESLPHIIDALHDGHWKVRAAAVKALGDLGDRRALVPLSAALHDESDNVRQEAADAIGEFYEEK